MKTLYIRAGPLATRPRNVKEFFHLKLKGRQQERDLKKLVVGVAALTGVTTLHLALNHRFDDHHPEKLSLLRVAWSASTPSLRSLVLYVPLEDLAEALNRGAVHLPHLEDLSMRIFELYRTSDNSALLQDALLPFLQTNCASICSLKLDCQTDVDLTPFLMRAPHLPSLTSLRVMESFVGFAQSSLKGHSHFLNLHKDRLRRIFMEFCLPYEWHNPIPTSAAWYAQEWLSITFPALEAVDVGLKPSGAIQTTYSSGAIEHCLRHASTLCSLALKHVSLNQRHLDSLLSRKRFQCLTSLIIVLEEFLPSTLQTLRDGLPKLRNLHLSALHITEPLYAVHALDVDHYELTEVSNFLPVTEYEWLTLSVYSFVMR